MLSTTLILVHICGATIGLLSGFLSMALRKGSGLHAVAGNVFFVSMLMMSGSAVYIAGFLRPEIMNVIAGLLTMYLVATGWRAAKNRDGNIGAFDWIALLFAGAVGIRAIAFGFEAVLAGTIPKAAAPVCFIFGGGLLLCARADIRMLIDGGVTGAKRIGRHLTRMSFALFIATFSLYPGQAKLFPQSWRASGLLFIPHILLISAMIFWTVRIRARKRAEQSRAVSVAPTDAIAA